MMSSTSCKDFAITTASLPEIEYFTATRTEALSHRCPSDPTVSVCMITYNHEKYIAQSIDSVLMQQTDFPVEIVIGEDYSSDRTREIVVDYQQRYPDKIRALLSTENLGKYTRCAQLNLVRNIKACRGRYVALLEGDDYWTDRYKLQKQVDFLKSRPDCSYCFHNVVKTFENEKGQEYPTQFPSLNVITGLEDILKTFYTSTLSIMFVNGLITEFPKWYYYLAFGDWSLGILLAEHGKIGHIDECMGVKRSHPGGVWTSKHVIKKCESFIDGYRTFEKYFNVEYGQDNKYSRIVKFCLSKEYLKLANNAYRDTLVKKTILALLNCYRYCPAVFYEYHRTIAKILINLCFLS